MNSSPYVSINRFSQLLVEYSGPYSSELKVMAPELSMYLSGSDLLDAIVRYAESRKKLGQYPRIAASTYNLRITALVSFLKYLRKIERNISLNEDNHSFSVGWLDKASQFDHIEKKLYGLRYKISRSATSTSRLFRRVLSYEEVSKLVDIADPCTKVLIGMLFQTGAHVSELLSLRWTDITESGELYLIGMGSGDKAREVWIQADLFRALLFYYPKIDDSAYIFMDDKRDKPLTSSMVSHRIKRVSEKLGVEYQFVSAKSLRAALADYLLNTKHIRLEQVAAYLGIRNLSSAYRTMYN
jgi:integrase